MVALAPGLALLLCFLQGAYGVMTGTSQLGLSLSSDISSDLATKTSNPISIPTVAPSPNSTSFGDVSATSSKAASSMSILSSSAVTSQVTKSATLNATSLTAPSAPSSTVISSVASSRSTTADTSYPTQSADPGTAADIATILDRRLSIIIEGIGNAHGVAEWLSTLGTNGKWPDSEIDYTTGCDARRANWPAEGHWQRLVVMAAAWHGGVPNASNYVNDSSLLAAISSAMDYWFINDFTDSACLDQGGLAACPCGTPGFWNTNWFSNIIGIPALVGETCNLVGAAHLVPTQLSNCTNILDRAFGTFGRHVNGLGYLTGANTLDVAKIGIDSGLLTGNATLVAAGYQHIHSEVVVQNAVRADGIRADGSFGQHGGIIYNGNYGKDYTNDALALEIAAAGTQYSAQNANTSSQSALETLLDGDLWMVFLNVITGVRHWDFSVLPRFITFPVSDGQATASLDMNISQIQQLGQLWGSEIIQSVAESFAANSSTANAGDINGNRMFYANDYLDYKHRMC
uniref:Hyaluronate lyase (HYase)) n=1 Tax=Ganoderma boninense TaxID=34458 RepID=A0A5K1JW20_9APHY|nr:Hyaluronate lyase (EC (Hyaluronidase) (HYase) [Ganoderma boninense]